MARPLIEYLITPHAAAQLLRRGMSEDIVRRVLASPEQRRAVRPGRDVFQAKATFAGKAYLVRVFVDVDRQPAEVVTAYRTSRIKKYRRNVP